MGLPDFSKGSIVDFFTTLDVKDAEVVEDKDHEGSAFLKMHCPHQ
jgi:hypothetical protein